MRSTLYRAIAVVRPAGRGGVATALVFCAGLTACAHGPKRMYDGPALPRAEIAEVWSALPVAPEPGSKVRSDSPGIGRLYILTVDGRPTDEWNENFARVVHVLPGRHVFKVRLSASREISPGRLGLTRRAEGNVEATLSAGEAYAIDAAVDETEQIVRFTLRQLRPEERPPRTLEANLGNPQALPATRPRRALARATGAALR